MGEYWFWGNRNEGTLSFFCSIAYTCHDFFSESSWKRISHLKIYSFLLDEFFSCSFSQSSLLSFFYSPYSHLFSHFSGFSGFFSHSFPSLNLISHLFFHILILIQPFCYFFLMNGFLFYRSYRCWVFLKIYKQFPESYRFFYQFSLQILHLFYHDHFHLPSLVFMLCQ